ncbi:MAG: restriction endonuclease subunit S, partial [Ruminococcus sp.]|nr:restriction endonuclease subunit S [Ruminococcus sp.]
YLYYIGNSSFILNQLLQKIHSSAQPKINKDDLKTTYILIPPVEEQEKIVNYLDKQCGEIDKIIDLKKQQIDLLKEYKKNLITETVIKGLNKDVEMKDSGVAWVEKIPKHWEVRKIKYIGSVSHGLTYKPKDLCENGMLVLRSSNIQNGKICLDDNVYVSCEIKPELMVKKDDILICARNGSKKLVGKSAIIKDDIKATFGAFMMILRCNCAEYMYYILNSNIFSYYSGTFSTSTINQLTITDFNNMKVLLPPVEEQEEIVKFLDVKCKTIDKIIDLKNQQINLLHEYKKTLIYEYVTGKQEV